MTADLQLIEQHCESCNVYIKVYPHRAQGFINWERHQAGEKHQRKLMRARRADLTGPMQERPNPVAPSVHSNTPVAEFPSPKLLMAPPLESRLSHTLSDGENRFPHPTEHVYSELPNLSPFSRTTTTNTPSQPTCTGLLYTFSAQQNIYLDYPWAIHAEYALEWTPEIVNEHLYLRSLRCTRTVVLWSSPVCEPCARLTLHPQVIAIRERALNGCSEKTNHSYLTTNQLHELLDRRIAQVKSLKLGSLNHGRAIASRATVLGDFNRFLMAVASGKVERMSALVSVALRNGVGLSGILERIQRAINFTYAPRSYSSLDYEKGVLALRLGGAQMLHLLHRASGFPHIRTIQRHTAIPQLQASPGLPTLSELRHNLQATALDSQNKKTGAVLMLDEIALKKALRFDIYRNHILGLCREHTPNHCSVEFASYEDAAAVLQALQDEKIHLASEVSP